MSLWNQIHPLLSHIIIIITLHFVYYYFLSVLLQNSFYDIYENNDEFFFVFSAAYPNNVQNITFLLLSQQYTIWILLDELDSETPILFIFGTEWEHICLRSKRWYYTNVRMKYIMAFAMFSKKLIYFCRKWSDSWNNVAFAADKNLKLIYSAITIFFLVYSRLWISELSI